VSTRIWVDAARREAAEQMAIDAAMPAVAGQTGSTLIRLYQWSTDTLSLGAHEAAVRTWNRTLLERDGIPVVRRPTGGRGVWHAATDLTYAWAGPLDAATARTTHAAIHRQLARSLRALGVEASIAPRERQRVDLQPGACFELAVGGEVLVRGRKAIGSAQRVSGSHGLQHGAIARSDQARRAGRYRLDTAIPATPAPRAPEEAWPEASALAAQIVADWVAAGASPASPELTETLQTASVQELERFRRPAWTWRR
jgi:lipoate-protein ligase A